MPPVLLQFVAHSPASMRRLSLLLVVMPGCTYGQVSWESEPVASSTVKITNCEDTTWETTTESDGYYQFDGNSDKNNIIPPGLLLIRAQIEDYERYEVVDHTFSPCPDDPSLDCDRLDISFGPKPNSDADWEEWQFDNMIHNNSHVSGFHLLCDRE